MSAAFADAVEEDLESLGAIAARAIAYVRTGDGPHVLGELAGMAAALELKVGGGSRAERKNLLAKAAENEDAALERLGRVYAAAAGKGHVEELAGDLLWVEQLIWEAGKNGPSSFAPTAGATSVALARLERRMRDGEPLVRAIVAPSSDFARRAFAANALGAPDAAEFFVANAIVVEEVLRAGEPESIARLETAKTPVAPFAAVLADLAVDARPALRRAALGMLARDVAAARPMLRAIAEGEERRTKERDLAARALEKIDAAREPKVR